MLIMYIDGACFGNPGLMGIGIVAYKNGKLIKKISERIGNGTNNIAEYSALIRALEFAKNIGEHNVEIRSDSELLIKQLNREYKVKTQHIKELNRRVRELAKEMNIKFCWIPREKNKVADSLSNRTAEGETPSKTG
ncbi:MAG: ribonuclease HI family protein [Candidatus Micrarchaeota archaeon]